MSPIVVWTYLIYLHVSAQRPLAAVGALCGEGRENPAMCEFATFKISRLRRKSGLTGAPEHLISSTDGGFGPVYLAGHPRSRRCRAASEVCNEPKLNDAALTLNGCCSASSPIIGIVAPAHSSHAGAIVSFRHQTRISAERSCTERCSVPHGRHRLQSRSVCWSSRRGTHEVRRE